MLLRMEYVYILLIFSIYSNHPNIYVTSLYCLMVFILDVHWIGRMGCISMRYLIKKLQQTRDQILQRDSKSKKSTGGKRFVVICWDLLVVVFPFYSDYFTSTERIMRLPTLQWGDPNECSYELINVITGFVQRVYRWPVNSPHKGPVTRKVFPFDDGIMVVGRFCHQCCTSQLSSFESWISKVWCLDKRPKHMNRSSIAIIFLKCI